VTRFAYDLQGRVAVVTGSSQGMGASIAYALAEHGASVVVAGRDPERVDRVVREIEEGTSARAAGCAGDLMEMGELDRLAGAAGDLGPVGILVNNAGGFAGRMSVSEGVDLDDWNSVMTLNLTIPMLTMRRFLPGMVEAGWGRVINIGSAAARMPRASRNAAYVAAKTGLVGLTKHVAHEVARRGVTANVVNPGAVGSERMLRNVADKPGGVERMTADVPVARLGLPDEIAAVVPFLASDLGAYTTGAVLDVSGGIVMY
jgi:NAD(P)-dependent dehydrogenase (short-subunit alcohol dehydrogenase family)